MYDCPRCGMVNSSARDDMTPHASMQECINLLKLSLKRVWESNDDKSYKVNVLEVRVKELERMLREHNIDPFTGKPIATKATE